MNIGEKIKQRRLELGLPVDDVAKKLGKNRATIYRYESNEIENMPITVLAPLAKILETTPAYLMGWLEEPSINTHNNISVTNSSKVENLNNNKNHPNKLDSIKRITDNLATMTDEEIIMFERVFKHMKANPNMFEGLDEEIIYNLGMIMGVLSHMGNVDKIDKAFKELEKLSISDEENKMNN